MTRPSVTQTQQQTSTTHPLSTGGILQRKCASCGQHTIAGDVCPECEKQDSLIQRSPNGVASMPASPIDPFFPPNSAFNHDISQVPVHQRRPLIQAKLTVGEPGDQYEQEADRVADEIMRMPDPAVMAGSQPTPPLAIQRLNQEASDEKLHRQYEEVPEEEEDEEEKPPEVQTKALAEAPVEPVRPALEVSLQRQVVEPLEEEEEEAPVQAKKQAGQTPHVTPSFEERLAANGGRGEPLPSKARTFMESRFGRNFSGVRVHADSEAAQLNRELRAQAFTHGQEVYLGAGSYSPETRSGKQLLAHELVHVIQQHHSNLERVQRDFTTTTTEAGPEAAETSLPSRPTRPPHEIVLMSGGPVSNREDREHDRNPLNFATAARIRIEQLTDSAFGGQRQMIPQDQITWVVMRPPYRYRALEDNKSADEYTNLLQEGSIPKVRRHWNNLAERWREQHPEEAEHIPTGEEAIQLYFVDSSSDFVNFMNEGADSAGRAAMSFSYFSLVSMPVGRFEYFGHGTPGQLWFTYGWEHLGSVNQSFSTDDIASLDPTMFISEGEYRSWSCNTATPPGNNQASFVQSWVERLGGRFVGAVGRTTYEYIVNEAEVRLSTESYRSPLGTRPAYWTTTQAVAENVPTGTTPAAPLTPTSPSPTPETVPSSQYPGWVHESELPVATESTSAPTAETPEERALRSIGERARQASSESVEAAEPSDLVCRADIVPLNEPALPGDLVCSPEGSGRLNLQSCTSEDVSTPAPISTPAPSSTGQPAEGAPGLGFYQIHEIYIDNPNNLVAPDANDPAWHPFLQAIADRAYNETLDTDSAPGTGANMINVAREVRARSRGFYVGVVERNGRVYYKIYGSRGARAGIPGRWYAAHNLPRTSTELGRMVNPRIGLGAGLRSGSVGLGGVLTVGGTTLDYAVDPQKEFGTDYAVDVAFDLVKTAGSSAAAGAAGAAVTGWLAAGALGATIGSAAPVIGTVIGFAVGVLTAMAIEYFIGDYRASLKAWLRGRHDIRGGSRRPGHRGEGEK